MRTIILISLVAVLITLSTPATAAADWSIVDQILQKAIQNKVFPGCSAAVADGNGFLYLKSFGNLTYGIPPPYSNGQNPPVTDNTLWDMASLTKVVATTTAIMTFYQRGELDLNMKVSDPQLLGPAFANNGKEDITVMHLLLHNSGFPPDPNPNYWQRGFGCPETFKEHPEENFSCQRKIFKGLMTQTLDHPVGSTYVYSDLSMITLQYIIGKLARVHGYVHLDQLYPPCAENLSPTDPEIDQCYYEAYVRIHIFNKLSMTATTFLPPKFMWGLIPPAWNDTDYRHFVVQGQVSDGNAYALGGIAGHAGLFSSVVDTMKLTRRLLVSGPSDSFLNSTTIDFFTKAYNLSQSSRALGWDTNDYKMNTYRGCGSLSSTTYTHTGYTGTQICNDPERKISALLFTNRVYPNTNGNVDEIKQVRRQFSDAIAKIVDSMDKNGRRTYVKVLPCC